MKPFNLSQYMLTLSQAAGAGLVGYNASNTYPAGSVGAAIKANAAMLPSATLTPGSVAFAGAGGRLAEDNANFFWDDANNRLGIGMNNPALPLQVKDTIGVKSVATGYTSIFLDGFRNYGLQALPSADGGGGLRFIDNTATRELLRFKVDGSTSIPSSVAAVSFSISPASNFYLGALGASAHPLINWDANDYTEYDQANNALNFVIAGAMPLQVMTHAVNVENLAASTSITAGVDITAVRDVIASRNMAVANAIYTQNGPGFGPAVFIGNDCGLWDVNIADCFAIRGNTNNNNGYITFGTNNIRLGCNANDNRLIYGAGTFAYGMVQSQATGLSCGFQMWNPNVGHDYRLIAKDAGHLAITNETIGVEYVAHRADGNTYAYNDWYFQNSISVTFSVFGGGYNGSVAGTHTFLERNGTCIGTWTTNTDYNAFVFNRLGPTVGTVWCTAGGTSYNSSSDVRLKTNIIDSPLDTGAIIDVLKVRAFDWRDHDEHVRLGFVAQEVFPIYPEAVTIPTIEDDPELHPWTMDVAKFVPLLIKEMQALRARVAELEAKP